MTRPAHPPRRHPPRIARLRTALDGPLPGAEAHRDAWPETLPARRLVATDGEPLREAAILIALFFEAPTGRWLFPLIRRTPHMRHHARQIGFPGGARGHGESPEQCALRESNEEIGLDPQQVQILGRLSRVEIPVSGFAVDPVVAWLPEPPDRWRPQVGEVDALLLADLDALVARGPSARYVRDRDGERLDVPAFEVGGAKVWGASALIIAELRRIWPAAGDTD